jgi:WD40 repeat protein
MSETTPTNSGAAQPQPTTHWERPDDLAGPAHTLLTQGRAGTGTPPPTDGAAPLPQVPGYEVLEELGRGGMGVVYRARQLSLNRVVALKMVRPGAAAGAPELARLRGEAETLARLGHPNIVQVYEVGEYDGLPFFAMEYLEGGSLAQRLAASALPPDESARLVQTLAGAVHAAHERGVVHRDLKPGNVLLAADGTPKVSDFGLAKRLEGGPGQTQSGAVLGTPAYMPPEQAAGRAHAIGPAADVYALGAVLYRLLTGRPPFRESNTADTLTQVLTADPARPRALNRAVPRDLETVCLKCLQKEPLRRYASAAELADDLGRFLRREPIRARRAGPAERLALWVLRRPALAAAYGLLALVVALLGLGAGVTWLWARAEAARDDVARKQGETEAALRRAEEEQARANRAEEEVKQLLALRNVSAALGHWRDNELPAARAALAGCEPGRRGWEWRFVNGLCRPDQRALTVRAPAPVLGSCFSPDGKRLAACCGGAVRVWDADTGKECLALTGHAPFAFALMPCDVRFSPDGRLLAAPGRDNTVSVWDARTGKAAFALKGHTRFVHAIAFSADGRRVATGGADGTVRLWDARTGKEERSLKGLGAMPGVCFSPDGRHVAAAGSDRIVHVWDAATGREEARLDKHTMQVTGVAYAPDGRRLASSSYDGTVRVWDLAAGEEAFPPLRHRQAPLRVCFSPDGRRLASAGLDRVVHLWDAGTGQGVVSLQGHTDIVSSVGFSPDGARLLSSGLDKSVRLWGARAGRESLALTVSPNPRFAIPAWGVGFSAGGREVVGVASDGTVRAWDAASGREAWSALARPTPLVKACLSPDGRLLAAAAGDVARVWEARTGKALCELAGHTARVTHLAFSPDGRQLVTTSDDRTARLWDAQTGRGAFVLTGHTAALQWACFSPDGRRLATTSKGVVRLWDVASGQALATFETDAAPSFVYFSPDGERLLISDPPSVAPGDCARVLDARTGRPLLTLRGHSGSVIDAAFSPDGERLATLGRDNTLRLWDARSGREVLLLRVPGELFARVLFSPDGRRLAVGSHDGAVHVWDAPPEPR